MLKSTFSPVFKHALYALFVWLLSGVAHANLPIESWTTPTGTRVLFVRAAAIPMLDINIDFDAGGQFAPVNKTGVAGLTLELLDKAAKFNGQLKDENQLADAFADIGAILTGGASIERASVQLRTLSYPAERDQAVALLAAILQQPQFPESVLTREKANLIAALREAETRPESLLDRHFSALLYPNHPYGYRPTPESVAQITVADLQAFYQAHYSAPRAVISMIGNLTRAEAEAIAQQLTANLPAGITRPNMPAVPTPQDTQLRARVEKVAHPASQAHIAMGLPAAVRGDPDYFPLLVGNYVLGGGGFVSRLMHEVREKRGLAYSVYSYFDPRALPGPFQIGLQTKKEQAEQALQVVNQTLAQFLNQGPTASELTAAKQNLVNGFPLRIDSNRKLLDNLAMIGFYKLPLNYLDEWTAQVERVTLAEIRAAFQRKVPLNQLSTVIVGAARETETGSGATTPATPQ